MPSQRVVILQRVVPHYRRELFRRLNSEFGWIVACADVSDTGQGFKLIRDEEFIFTFPFRFPIRNWPYVAMVPVASILSKLKPQVVIAEFSASMTSTYELLLRRMISNNFKVIFWSHGFNMERPRSGLHHLVHIFRSKLAALADGHICYSNEGASYLRKRMAPERVFVARNSIAFKTANISGIAATSRTPRLITIGRLTPDKDIIRLVRIFRRLRETMPDIELTIIGDGPCFPAILDAVASLPPGAIELTGELYDENEIAKCFARADLAVFPGAVGLGVNHALGYGVPVLAYERTPAGPHHHPEIEYVENGISGYLVRPYTEDGLFCALKEILSEGSPRVRLQGKL